MGINWRQRTSMHPVGICTWKRSTVLYDVMLEFAAAAASAAIHSALT
jgi:hypothetical protein